MCGGSSAVANTHAEKQAGWARDIAHTFALVEMTVQPDLSCLVYTHTIGLLKKHIVLLSSTRIAWRRCLVRTQVRYLLIL